MNGTVRSEDMKAGVTVFFNATTAIPSLTGTVICGNVKTAIMKA